MSETNIRYQTMGADDPREGSGQRISRIAHEFAADLHKVTPGEGSARELHERWHELFRPTDLDYIRELDESLVRLDEALRRSADVHKAALRDAGLPESAVDVLQSWVSVTVDTHVITQHLQQAVVAGRAAIGLANPHVEDPSLPLSANALGLRLGIGDQRVRERETAGQLFSVMKPGRQRGREYPVFQAWPGVAGAPLAEVLKALGAPVTKGPAAYGFFTSPTDLLEYLTPIELMTGRLTRQRSVEPGAQRLLGLPESERLDVVLETAKAYRADLDA